MSLIFGLEINKSIFIDKYELPESLIGNECSFPWIPVKGSINLQWYSRLSAAVIGQGYIQIKGAFHFDGYACRAKKLSPLL